MDWFGGLAQVRGFKTNARDLSETSRYQGTLIGWKQISQYTGLCMSTLIRYTRSDGFPACHLPDKRMFTTKTLVDQWVMARMVIEQGLDSPVYKPVDKSDPVV